MLRTVFSRANAKSMQHCFGTFCFSFTVNWMNFGIFNSSIYSIKFQKGFALSTTFWEHTEPKNAYVINLKILQTNIYRIVVVFGGAMASERWTNTTTTTTVDRDLFENH